MFTDNYDINEASLNFIEHQSIPNLSDEIYLELAPKFTDYQAPYFICKVENTPNTFDLNSEFSGIKSDFEQIEYVEDKPLNLSDEQIKAGAQKVIAKFKKEYEQEIASLSFTWNFEISSDLSIIKIQDDKPEEDLMWAENAAQEFIDHVEKSISKEKQDWILDELDGLSIKEIQQYLELSSLWISFKPETKYYLYAWKRDPQSALQEILQAMDSYSDKLSTDNIAVDVYEMYADSWFTTESVVNQNW